ncbi:LLM class flavin-dependent oxidoreductase [Nocardia mexicana]|uniref:Alkanesulfonate monooxygenase SsuD/methylene tetrahydromethanopterin reductase-like flavin-dependent oxidoreductase (Luciferase family) n=1 Tax=Nocardia mexicana TaxID=279262 RepID=A0A370HB07_9NOCA|nr:LLM class flavin-dependent oxidoreductase [Nocardia mexicana]RDI53244.1 alkanesulfonate monooxygenase SsuD/methylene tetrahydromethanopterin reductase-like flavin-dependent oxidoreductase (luciferase family) [Nocardia mexicana]
MSLDIGITLPTLADADGPETAGGIVDAARHVERLGFESVWVPDLIIGDGTPGLDSVVTLAAVAAATERVRIGFGVLTLAMRPTVQIAAQIQALQHLSGDRVLLGIGVGGFPYAPFWRASGISSTRRGPRTDAALAALPGLITGRPTAADEGPAVTLTPAATMPPVLIGGNSEAAIRRTARFGDSWFPSLVTANELAAEIPRLTAAAAESGRATPGVTVGGHAMLSDDDSARIAFVRSMIDAFGMSGEDAARLPITGDVRQVADRLAAYRDAGAERLVLGFDGPEWAKQAEALAEARSRLR